MDKSTAQIIVKETLQNSFDKTKFINLIKNLLNNIDESKAFPKMTKQYVKEIYRDYVSSYERIATYTDPENKKLDILIVYLQKTSLERARTAQRNFAARYLKDRGEKDAGLIVEYKFTEGSGGKVKVKEEFTPAKRYSFLVGKNEDSHTAQSRIVPVLMDIKKNPDILQIEDIFSVEKVTKEFFERYRGLFLRLKEYLDEFIKNEKSQKIKKEFDSKNIDTIIFCKKLLGQIVFLYFIQKKGWLGAKKEWGDGDKKFLRALFDKCAKEKANYFNDYIEYLFYDAYDWQGADIKIANEIFSDKANENDEGKGILDLFDLFNFTVKEDEPLEKEVAVDPEMLGKVFENLLEVKDRKSKGTYYTPREIVHYMCQQSLINYLATELEGKVPKDDIEVLIKHGESAVEHEARVEAEGRETRDYSYKLPDTIRKYYEVIDQKLADIRVCDPAIGSGAFPVGMMNEIVRARNTLTSYISDKKNRDAYNFKRHAIQNCLYGVDIDPGAVEIAKLRLWLSLIVDEEDIKHIKPLPNLDYKVVCGDSLLGVEKTLFNSIFHIEYERLKTSLFNETNASKKNEIKKKINEIIIKISRGHKEFDYELYFSEVFNENGGFDIVIGNPPYIGFHGITQKYKKTLKELYKSASGKYDIYITFIEKGYYILKPGGYFTFICPSAFAKRDYGKEIRSFILKKATIKEMIDFEHTQMFDNATNYTCVFSFVSSQLNKYEFIYKKGLDDKSRLISNQEISENPWIFADNEIKYILGKISKGSPLGDIAKISEGVVTGLNDLYLKQLNEIKKCKFETRYFVPCYRGKEIKAYYLNPNAEYLFYPYKKIGNKTVPISESELQDESPNYYAYLKENKNKIIKRKYFVKSNKKWYELWNQRDLGMFLSKKIITPEMSECNRFAIAPENTFYGDTACGISIKSEYANTIDLRYLLAILNSSLLEWFYKQTTVPKAGGYYIYKNMFLKRLPIKVLPISEQLTYIENVNAILKTANGEKHIKNINQMVFKLYGLTDEEIGVVEGAG